METTADSPLIVAIIPPVNQPLPLVRRKEGDLINHPCKINRIGRTLYEGFLSLELATEKHANRAAYKLGMGPHAATRRIQAFLGNGKDRERKLLELGRKSLLALEKDCVRLMKYALPSETSETQIDTFKSLVMLTTRYPGVRRLFVKSRKVNNSEEDISALWDRPHEASSAEWDLYRNFAAACLADGDVCSIVEESEPNSSVQVLAPAQEGETVEGPARLISPTGAGERLGVVELLLVAADCPGTSNFSSRISIRYLGGILELSSFWVQTGSFYESVVRKILVKTKTLLEDLGLDSPDIDPTIAIAEADTEGIDILCQALVLGVRSWILEKPVAELMSQYWYQGVWRVLQLLRQPLAAEILPGSWALATSQELDGLFPTLYTDVIFESFLRSTFLSPGPREGPSDESEEPYDASGQLESRALPLLSADLPNTTITVSKAVFRPGSGLNIMLSVDPGNRQGWTIQKKISDFRVFDEKIREGLKKSGTAGIPAPLSGSGIWTDRSPRGLDPRKVRNCDYEYLLCVKEVKQDILRKYWEDILSCDLPPDMQSTLIAFLTQDVPENEAPESPGHKEGYMLKLGRTIGALAKLRYYVLDGSVLTYFDSLQRGGELLGSITVKGAYDIRLQSDIKPDPLLMTASEQARRKREGPFKPYRHALFIYSRERNENGRRQHVLCAESEEERRSWLKALKAAR
ncbi:hypothetical protein B0H19DRAFT_1231662 [Mycena capillaripes]|nr:hypothetical protein B0H19DRAFT_1231662 [Mycena capillaripes]